jgi:hypothetical protein
VTELSESSGVFLSRVALAIKTRGGPFPLRHSIGGRSRSVNGETPSGGRTIRLLHLALTFLLVLGGVAATIVLELRCINNPEVCLARAGGRVPGAATTPARTFTRRSRPSTAWASTGTPRAPAPTQRPARCSVARPPPSSR